jgi:hypothetical protein
MRHSPRHVQETGEPAWRYVAFAETLGFGASIAVIWLDELFDLPHRLLGAPASPTRLTEAAMESSGVALLAVVVLWYTMRLARRVTYLESYITLCAWCRRVRRGEEWLSIETYFAEHQATTSHGICPDCEARASVRDAGRRVEREQT